MNWDRVATFDVIGIPKAQPRPRAFYNKAIGKARVFESGTAEGWKGCIAMAARNHVEDKKLSGPIRICISFFMPRPQELMRKSSPDGNIPHVKKPDTDNLTKSVMDALTQIGAWGDDSQVCESYVTKQYAAKNQVAGALIQIFSIKEA